MLHHFCSIYLNRSEMIYSSLGASGSFFEAWYSQNEKDRREKESERKSDGGGEYRDRRVLQIEWRKGTAPSHTLEKLALNPGLSFSTLHISPSCLDRVLPEAGTLILCQSSTTKLSVRSHFIPVLGGMRQQFVPPHKTCNGGKKKLLKGKESKREKGKKNKQYFFFSQEIKI